LKNWDGVGFADFWLARFRLFFCVSLGSAFEFSTCYTGVEPEYPPLPEDEEEKKVKDKARDKDMKEDKVQEKETASAVRSRRRPGQQGRTPTAVRFARIKSDLR
jgi:hypothetical protein